MQGRSWRCAIGRTRGGVYGGVYGGDGSGDGGGGCRGMNSTAFGDRSDRCKWGRFGDGVDGGEPLGVVLSDADGEVVGDAYGAKKFSAEDRASGCSARVVAVRKGVRGEPHGVSGTDDGDPERWCSGLPMVSSRRSGVYAGRGRSGRGVCRWRTSACGTARCARPRTHTSVATRRLHRVEHV